jgi:methylamine--corrinoid protein Co-methyltransferase
MIPVYEFQHRSLIGPVLKEEEFDMRFSRAARKIIKEYGIVFNPVEIIADDALANTVFEAAVALLSEVGLYNRDTERIILFTEEEVRQVARDAFDGPDEVVFGRGQGLVTIRSRDGNDPRPPIYFMGNGGNTASEELYIPYTQSFLQEKYCDGNFGTAGLASYRGLEASVASHGLKIEAENKADTVGEMVVSAAELRLTQEAARRAGRNGIYLGPTTATAAASVMALFGLPDGHATWNTMVSMHVMPELKFGWSRLVLSQWCEDHGVVPWLSGISMMGLLCRGAEDAAVTNMAAILAEMAYGHGRMANIAPISLDGTYSRLENLWACSAVARAMRLNLRIPSATHSNAIAGLGTEMAGFERAAQTVMQVCSGSGLLWYECCRSGKGDEPASGLEGRLRGEISHAVAGLNRDQANELVLKSYELYRDQIESAPAGKTFAELYDVKKVEPTQEYLDIYQSTKDKLVAIGIPFKS